MRTEGTLRCVGNGGNNGVARKLGSKWLAKDVLTQAVYLRQGLCGDFNRFGHHNIETGARHATTGRPRTDGEPEIGLRNSASMDPSLVESFQRVRE